MRENFGWCRGKRTDNGEWVEGYYLRTKHYHCIITACVGDERVVYGNHADVMIYAVDPETVGECCGGLRDKNGKLAFEHNVTEDQWGRRWIIFGCEGGFGICRNTEWTRNSDGSVIIWNALADAQNADWFSHQHKIIGNIHDNSALLKGAD